MTKTVIMFIAVIIINTVVVLKALEVTESRIVLAQCANQTSN